MKRLYLLSSLLVLACVLLARAQEKPAPEVYDCSRIVSFAPSITEALFELGLGKNVVGVTRYDRYPAAAASLPRLGGLLDPNLEALMLLRPTLALMLREHGELKDRIRELGIQPLSLNHDNVESILESFAVLGAACEREAVAARLVARLRGEIDRVRIESQGEERLRVLVVVGSSNTSELKNLFVSGRDGFFSELLEIAGGENVYQNSTSGLMGFSSEGLLKLNPAILINIITAEAGGQIDEAPFKEVWQGFPRIDAVKNRRIFVLKADYMSVPGPRLDLALRDIRSLIVQVHRGGDGKDS